MTWELEAEEIQHLLALPAAERAVTFFQVVADWEEAWGLKDATGLIVTRETDTMPLWPHAAFAEACARGAWADTTPEPISLAELVEDLLPLLEEDGIGVAVFPAPGDAGTVMPPGELRERLERELEMGEG
jgi:hypothetical protein